MKDNKPWYEKIYIWIGIVAGICTILAFIITLHTKTDNAPEASINIIEDNSNIQDGVQINGDDNITITGNVSGDVNINKTPETKTSSESNTIDDGQTSQFNFGQAMQHIYNNEKKYSR